MMAAYAIQVPRSGALQSTVRSTRIQLFEPSNSPSNSSQLNVVKILAETLGSVRVADRTSECAEKRAAGRCAARFGPRSAHR